MDPQRPSRGSAHCSLALSLTLILAAVGTPAVAKPVDYRADVRPVLKARCFACHGALKQEAGLRLDAVALALKGGDTGAAITPGAAASSLLVERVRDPDPQTRMPPEGRPLEAAEIDVIVRWINAGAPAPNDDAPEPDPRRHWAFQPPHASDLDTPRNPIDVFIERHHVAKGLQPLGAAPPHTLLRRIYFDLIGLPPSRDELKAFVADPSPQAFDGVVDRLLASPRYGERWGRHWMDVWRYSDWYGRRAVPDVMNSYPQIWRWRDWIVRSLNHDKGYDRMVTEMLAADEVAPNDDNNIVATGFIVRNWYKWNYNQWMKDAVEHTGKAFLGITLNCAHCHDHKYDPITQEEYFRFRALFEPLELRHHRLEGVPYPGPFQKYVYGRPYGPIKTGAIRVFDEKLDAKTYMYSGGDSRNRIEGRPPVAPGVPEALGGVFEVNPVQLPVTAWYPALKDFVQADEIAAQRAKIEAAETQAKKVAEGVRQELLSVEPALASLRESIAATWKEKGRGDDDDLLQLERELKRTVLKRDTLKLREQQAAARLAATEAELTSLMARIEADRARHSEKRRDDTLVRRAGRLDRAAVVASKRVEVVAAELKLSELESEVAESGSANEGAVAKARENVDKLRGQLADQEATLDSESTEYRPIGAVFPKSSTGRRTALARWITNRRNPLAARVAVNHIWGRHFGRPLVESTTDFGHNGKKPTHPELLDWLAVELMENNWSMKHLHRLMVTSQTYRRHSSGGRAGVAQRNLEADPDNLFLWRMNARRVEAEVVRDSLLHVSHALDTTIGGHEIPHDQGLASMRRSLYFTMHAESKMQFLELFDAPDVCDSYKRTTSVVPQQALAFSNSELALSQSRTLARSLWDATAAESISGNRELHFITAAFEQVLSRQPNSHEKRLTSEFLAQQSELFRARSAATRSEAVPELGGVDGAGASGETEAKVAPPAPNPLARARESFIHALLSHTDFVTSR